MIVCICAGISERELRAVIADGATTMKQIERRCGAGSGCGACRPLVRECLRECRAACRAELTQVAVEFARADAPELATV
jgi:assimilatory nitrate reductase catalytic subunit